jgi:hypothetical protein
LSAQGWRGSRRGHRTASHPAELSSYRRNDFHPFTQKWSWHSCSMQSTITQELFCQQVGSNTHWGSMSKGPQRYHNLVPLFLLWFGCGLSPQSSCVETWFPIVTIFRGWWDL